MSRLDPETWTRDLLSWTPPDPLPAGGSTYDPGRDSRRLSAQSLRLYTVMKSGQWYTPEELEKATGDRWASLSARIREFRRPEFGLNASVEREYISDGLFRYRLALNEPR